MASIKLGILASTSGTDLQAIIDAIASGRLTDVAIVQVISNQAEAGVVERARRHGLPVEIVDHHKFESRGAFDWEVARILDQAGVDLVLMIGYMRIVTPWFVAHYANRMINVHPSLLPAFGGGMDLNVHQMVLDAGVKVTGCTLHLVTEEADSGPIIWQKAVEVSPDETVDSLKAKVQKLEQKGFLEVIAAWRDGRVEIDGNKVSIR